MPKQRLKKKLYFDYAASTPIHPKVLAAMKPYVTSAFGNPGSVHSFGQEAMNAIDKAREDIASAIGAQFREVIFTSGATEANNLVLRGVVENYLRTKKGSVKPNIIISAIEHESIAETARDLERAGKIELTVIPVDKRGVIDFKSFEAALNERTILVSCMYVNNEIGTLEPIKKISEHVRAFRTTSQFPLIHTDAAQAFIYFDCNIDKLGVDFMTLSAHKMNGPKGVGALYIRKNSPLDSMVTGGGQEFGLRSGTENVPAIVGCKEAVRLAENSRQRNVGRLRVIAKLMFRELKRIHPGVEINGAELSNDLDRSPHIMNVYLPGVSVEELLTMLDLRGVALSAGSACAARSLEPSPIIRALGHSEERARSSIRVSFGSETKAEDIRLLTRILKEVLRKT